MKRLISRECSVFLSTVQEASAMNESYSCLGCIYPFMKTVPDERSLCFSSKRAAAAGETQG